MADFTDVVTLPVSITLESPASVDAPVVIGAAVALESADTVAAASVPYVFALEGPADEPGVVYVPWDFQTTPPGFFTFLDTTPLNIPIAAEPAETIGLETDEVFLDYSPSTGGAPSTPDTGLPTVGPFNPAPGVPIARTQGIVFNVLDDSGSFAKILISVASKDTGIVELVYDGTFTAFWRQNSLRTAISNGFKFTIARIGGWRVGEDPVVRVCAIDEAGNVSDGTVSRIINLDFSESANSQHIVTIAL